jgi:hypothetical protein
MRKTPTTLLLVLALATPNATLAHGSGKDLMGTVESAAADQIVVKDRTGQTHHVRLDEKTRYRDTGGGAAEPSEIRPGDRVVVHLGVDADASTALEVQFGHPNPTVERR